MQDTADMLIEKIDRRPAYHRLCEVLDEWPSTDAARKEYMRFASDFLRDQGYEIEPAELGFVVNMFIALGQGSASAPIEQTLDDLGAPKEWAEVNKTLVENILEEPDEQLGPLVDVVRKQVGANGYSISDDALRALCAIEVALGRP